MLTKVRLDLLLVFIVWTLTEVPQIGYLKVPHRFKSFFDNATASIKIKISELQVNSKLKYLCDTVTSHGRILSTPETFLSHVAKWNKMPRINEKSCRIYKNDSLFRHKKLIGLLSNLAET